MVEWFKAAVLKTAVAQATLGSNPSSSASFVLKRTNKNHRVKKRAKLQARLAICSFFFTAYSFLQYARTGDFFRGVAGRLTPARLTSLALVSNPSSSASFLQKNGERRRMKFSRFLLRQGFGGQAASRDGVTFMLRFAYTAASRLDFYFCYATLNSGRRSSYG